MESSRRRIILSTLLLSPPSKNLQPCFSKFQGTFYGLYENIVGNGTANFLRPSIPFDLSSQRRLTDN
jgi:hypothetical protein